MTKTTNRTRTQSGEDAFELEGFVPYLIMQIYYRLNKSFAKSLQPLKLVPAQWRVIAILAVREGQTNTEILQLSALDQPTLSRTVERLVRSGHVARRQRSDDARAFEISLTATGRRLFSRALPVAMEQYELATKGVSSTDRKRFVSILSQVLGNVSAMAEVTGDES